jgi:acyl-CoA thioester hydrolase
MSRFTTTIRVYWEDTDAGGIVFYANYFKFFERARTEWLRSLGLGQQQLRDQWGGMFVVAQASCRYLAPARLDDLVQVTAGLSQPPGKTSLHIAQQATLHATSALLCSSSIQIAWVNATTLRPERMPQPLTSALNTP